MTNKWLSLEGIPAEGREITFEDSSFFQEQFKEFSMALEQAEPIRAEMHVIPQGEDGCLIKGRIHGSLTVGCCRCADTFVHPLDASFTLFEEAPGEEEPEGPVLVTRTSEGLSLDVEAVVWEQLALALPDRFLCARTCKGLCPKCGANLNEEECGCEGGEEDPRMAPFRNLKLS